MTSQQTTGASPSPESSQIDILDELREALDEQSDDATFALGGSVPISTRQDASKPSSASINPPSLRSSKPIHIRFGDSGVGTNLILPGGADSQELQSLLQACSPASFGRGGKDVLDPSYRKAGKLDTTDFATTFCPYETGIIEVVNQVLVTSPRLGTRAELYKLNVYSAPSGFFKSHVDTPRGKEQYGSLVVSLPVDHEGGQLVVRNASKDLVFDWSTSASQMCQPAIQWAAFYSDCEHEVREVTSGHRITLTYNLYTTRAGGLQAGRMSALEPTKLPLYGSLARALRNPSFLPGGRVLAIHLTHAYAHTSAGGALLPSSLKGADMAIYETARALNLACHVRPIVKYGWDDSDENWRTGHTLMGDDFAELSLVREQVEGNAERVEHMRDTLGESEKFKSRKVTWLNPEEEGSTAVQSVLLAYGNEAELELKYSHACLLIRVPPYHVRCGNEAETTSKIFEGIVSDPRRHDHAASNTDTDGDYDDDDLMDGDDSDAREEASWARTRAKERAAQKAQAARAAHELRLRAESQVSQLQAFRERQDRLYWSLE